MNTAQTFPPTDSPLKTAGSTRRNYFPTWIALLLLLLAGAVRAESPDDKYLNIVSLIDQADALNTAGQVDQAHAKYIQAQAALQRFKRDNATSNPKAVAYRLNYLAGKITTTAAKPPPDENASASSTGAPPDKKAPTAAAKLSQLKMLTTGAEPRAILRLHPGTGDQQSLRMTTKMAMTMAMGDTPTPAIKMPAMQINLDVTVKNVGPNGDITYETAIRDASVVNDPDVMPQVAEAMKASFTKFQGTSGTGILSDRGFNLRTEMKPPADADPQTRQTFDQLKDSFASAAVPLPEEAVGPGARWEVKAKLKSQGLTIDQTTTYELVSVEAGRITFKSTLAQTAANQKIQSPAMPGMKVDLTRMTSTGTGTTTFDLTKLMPTESSMDEHTEMVMGMNLGGQKQAMTSKTDVNVQLVGK